MSFIEWTSLATICILGAMSPGPSLALIIGNTVKGGRLAGIVTSLGHGVGVGLYAALTALGLGIIIAQTPWLFNVIQYAGALFLLYLAYKILSAKPHQEEHNSAEHSSFEGFRGGFLVAFLNPKLAVFFLALFSQFVNETQNWVTHLIMTLTAGGIDAIWYTIVALLVAHTQLSSYLSKHAKWFDRGSAVIFIALAALVILQS